MLTEDGAARDVFLALVEFEGNLTKESALVGLKTAHGRKGGRPKRTAHKAQA